jgi:hypothetical protein
MLPTAGYAAHPAKRVRGIDAPTTPARQVRLPEGS